MQYIYIYILEVSTKNLEIVGRKLEYLIAMLMINYIFNEKKITKLTTLTQISYLQPYFSYDFFSLQASFCIEFSAVLDKFSLTCEDETNDSEI